MPLATLAIPPDSEQSFFIWAQTHATHHYDCIRVAEVKFSQKFSSYVLDPFDPNSPEDMQNWLNTHQQMHVEMDKVLNVASYDLSELDWQDANSMQSWFAQNYIEHQQWAMQLGLG